MRRITFALMSTLAAVVLLFGYRTSTPSPVAASSTAVATGGTGGSATGTTTPAAPMTTSPTTTTPTTTTPTTTTSGTRTVTGSVAQTRWGPVQVQLTVTAGKVTDVQVLQQPSGNGRDEEINSAALPVLEQETLKAQSAHIDGVSGATVTSDGYTSSLQSALDQAGL